METNDAPPVETSADSTKPPKQDAHPNLNRGGTFPGGGRPKNKFSVTRCMREALEAEDGKLMKMLARAIILNAAKGNQAAMKIVTDRMDGPVTRRIALGELTPQQLVDLLEMDDGVDEDQEDFED